MNISAVVSGVETNLSDFANLTSVENFDGLGMASLVRLSETGPLQHGTTDYGFRLDARKIKLFLGIDAPSLSVLWTRRQTLLNIFKPLTNIPVTLKFYLDDGTIKQIDSYFAADMSMSSQDRSGFYQKIAITLICPDPTFYDPNQHSVSFGISAGSSSMNIPLTVPVNVGNSTVNQTQIINYTGTFQVNPVITIVGPITNPVIKNLTTGDKIDFTGNTIYSGVSYIIDTRYGIKTVVDNSGTNQIAKLTTDSTLATFSIQPDPVALGGNNVFNVTGTVGNLNTQVYIRYYTRYIGV